MDVANFGASPTDVRVVLKANGQKVSQNDILLQPGETRTVDGWVHTEKLKGDTCPVKAQLWQGKQRTDAVHSAFCIWDEQVVARGPRVGWQQNYLTINGEPALLIGTNQTGMMFFSANENPAVWERDFRLMAQHNIRILRILHFSPFAKDGYKAWDSTRRWTCEACHRSGCSARWTPLCSWRRNTASSFSFPCTTGWALC